MPSRAQRLALTLTTAACMTMGGTAMAAGTTTSTSITSTTASLLAQKAVAACTEAGYVVSVSVVDNAGVLLSFIRADGAGPHTVKASQAKAYTSASSRNPTSGIAKAVQSNPDAAGMTDIPDFLVLAGGVPIKVGNATVGGICVAGAPGGHLDEACAQKALEAVQQQLAD